MYLFIYLLRADTIKNDEVESTPRYKAKLLQPCVQGYVNGCGGYEKNDNGQRFQMGSNQKLI